MEISEREYRHQPVDSVSHNIKKRDVSDEICHKQETNFLQSLSSGTKIDAQFAFENASEHYSMALAWAGENDGVLIVVTCKSVMNMAIESKVYRSADSGKTFQNINSKFGDVVIQKHNGLQRNTNAAKKVYLVAKASGKDQNKLFVSEDGGMMFNSYSLSFAPEGEFMFNPKDENSLMVISEDKELYVSLDNAKSWIKKLSKVNQAKWGMTGGDDQVDTVETIYAAVGEGQTINDPFLSHFFNIGSVPVFNLMKSDDGGINWRTIQSNIVSFGHTGSFLYASVLRNPDKKDGDRFLKISTDGGKVWTEANLPDITPDRFYSVLDMSEGMVFLHVDNPEDTGHGTLYTSANEGTVYSTSLERHLYPNYLDVTDFYPVKSMRGVYITSQMSPDKSIHTVISYNRGATWQNITRPPNVKCKDENKACNLQLHGLYSMSRQLSAKPPLSEETATGIILAHGHVADALQTTPPDVFVSSDGGYSWRLALTGPHHYVIGDHGGLLVAVPQEMHPKVIKFSTDEGRCWHEYNFTTVDMTLTGLLTEPGAKSSVVSIWGYRTSDRRWKTHVINFQDIIPKKCVDSDYELWIPHTLEKQKYGAEYQGCLLGSRETIMRLKKDSWCYNGYERVTSSKKETCKCTKEDYECEYGFEKEALGSDNCVKMGNMLAPEIDICVKGHLKKEVTDGYRKIPGDKCEGGYVTNGEKVDLKQLCSQKTVVINDEEKVPEGIQKKHVHTTVIVIVVILILFLIVLMSVYFIRKYVILQRHRVVYKYSMLNQSDKDLDEEFENQLSPTVGMYQDSDEELTTATARPTANGHTPKDRPKAKPTSKVKSYHDDSDDDMLS